MKLVHVLRSLAAAYCFVVYGSSFQLHLASDSTISGDVRTIAHEKVKRHVHIVLEPIRRCLHPTFVVRLSGAALYLAELESHNDTEYTFGYPCILDRGTYFVEIIILYCDQFNSSNYSNLCVKSPVNKQNVVSLPYEVHLEAEADCNVGPRWLWRSNNPKNLPSLLPTRHQRNISELASSEHCESGMIAGYCNPSEKDIWQYQQYDWVDAPDYTKLAASVANDTHPVIHMCYVGDSHSRELARVASLLAGNKNRFTHFRIPSVLPSMFNVSSLSRHMCSVAVISFGQWLFNNKVPPITKERYALEIRRVMEQLVPGVYSGPTKVFFRTENYNGLGAHYTSCPPLDYRSVPAVNMMNEVLRDLSLEHQFDFIDLTHIQAVHWDGAPDYNHPSAKVLTAEVEWILHYVLNITLSKGYNLTTYAVHEEPHRLPKLSTYQENLALATALKALASPP